MPDAYQPKHVSTTRDLDVRGLRYRLREWGPADAPLLLFLHGHQDTAATFQFLIDAFERPWRIVAPDWRGHGGSQWAPQGYWYQDYLADLDVIADAVSPDAPLSIVGHSLGGNVANVYAGVRPERVSQLVSLDGFGLRDRPASGAPDLLRRWLDAVRADPSPERVYPSHADMAARLASANPKLPMEKALFLAQDMARPVPGGFAWAFDPAHRTPFPTLARVDEAAACWSQMTARALWIVAGERDKRLRDEVFTPTWRVGHIARGESVVVPDVGHNVHHDAPETVARHVENFLSR